MKYTRKLTVILAMATMALTTTACKKDKEDPTITVTTPTEHSHHSWGATVHVEATFTDDQGLKNYTVMIGDEEGNHNHNFDFMKSGDISGASYDFHDHFDVPTDAPMMAWVHFTVTDLEDKTATMKWMLHFDE